MKTIKYISLETAYNKFVKEARSACKGLVGYERAVRIKHYFTDNGHPQYTFDQLLTESQNYRQFAINLLKTMATLCAENDHGYYLEGDDQRWFFEKCVGGGTIAGVAVNRYSVYGANSKQLITVEYDKKVHGSIIFDDVLLYEKWLDTLGLQDPEHGGLSLTYAIAKKLDPNFAYNE